MAGSLLSLMLVLVAGKGPSDYRHIFFPFGGGESLQHVVSENRCKKRSPDLLISKTWITLSRCDLH